MNDSEIENALKAVKEANSQWDTARAKFLSDVRYIMNRLINEAVAQYMSAEDISRYSGLTVKRVRLEMRAQRLDPKGGRRALAKTAADTLKTNALIMGVEPKDMDLMSPLAYLPMGQQMRKEFLETEAVKTGVHEVPEDNMDRLIEVYAEAWHSTAPGEPGTRTRAGLTAVFAAMDAKA